MEQLFNICGWIGSLGLILGYLPQAIQTIRTRTTDGISLPGFIMMAVGAFATSGGSSIKKACEDLKAAYPDVNWKEGKLLNRASKQELETWIKGL